MNFRTDLALERQEMIKGGEVNGVKVKKWKREKAEVTQIQIIDKQGEKVMGKPIGKYITVDLPEFSHESELLDGRMSALTQTVKELLPKNAEKFLVAGLGNDSITPDALGPLCAKEIFATRHIQDETAKEMGFESLNSVAAVETGVLGQTGIETAEYIKGIVNLINPDAVIIVDALASRSLARLGKTVQLSDTGIVPGSGVGNARAKIDKETLGVPVISIGVPTVVDGVTIVYDLTEGKAVNKKYQTEAADMMVTPRDIDTVITRAAKLLSLSINCALQPDIEPQIFLSL